MEKWGRRLLLLFFLLLAVVLVGPFLIPVPELSGLQPPQALAGAESQFTRIPFPGTGGINIHYRQAGSGDSQVILLHGFSSNVYTWDDVFDFFASTGTTFAYDRPPFGLSERLLPGDWDEDGSNPYTTTAAVEQLRAFMDGQGVEQVLLVGNSAGGLIALQAAQTYPARVTGLILVDPAVYNSGAPTFLAPFANTPQLRRLGPLIARAFAGSEGLFEMAFHNPDSVTEAEKERAAIGTRVHKWDEAFWQFTAAATSAQGVVDRVPATTVPALVITGENDQIVAPEDSARLASELPNAELVTIPSCGHLPHDECPEQFIQIVSAWLAQTGLGDGTSERDAAAE